jgi:hypothetical protein
MATSPDSQRLNWQQKTATNLQQTGNILLDFGSRCRRSCINLAISRALHGNGAPKEDLSSLISPEIEFQDVH